MTLRSSWSLGRRNFLRRSLGLLSAPAGLSACKSSKYEQLPLPPVRAITRGPRFHWFGYYDKLEFDPTDRFVLGNEVDFEGRKPEATDLLRVGMVDTEMGDEWLEIGESYAWNWQQGCMLQWIPGDGTEVIWNDREGDAYVSRIVDATDLGAGVRTLPRPIFCLSPDGSTAFTIDFARIQYLRPGYGYPGIPDPYRDQPAPEASGIWRMNLATGESELIFSIADAERLDPPQEGWRKGVWHWLYHLLVSPDGKRLAMIHCNSVEDAIECRMITIDLDGGNPFVLDPNKKTSHYDWRDGQHVLAWAADAGGNLGFFLFTDRTREVEQIGEGLMEVNGHCTYLEDPRWILNDTYPDQNRNQNPFLFDAETNRLQYLGHFFSPEEYRGEFRCDTHPRSSRDGRTVIVDSPHAGGRQMYLIDISELRDELEA